MLVGSVADAIAGFALVRLRKTGQIPTEEKAAQVARRYTALALAASARHAQSISEGKAPPFGAMVLSDHVWGTTPSISDEVLVDRVVTAVTGFVKSGVVRRLSRANEAEWPMPRRPEDPRPEAWRLGEGMVSTAPDLWLVDNKRFVILDWKAAREAAPDNGFQLSIYGLWAITERKLSVEDVFCQIVLMPTSPAYSPAPIGEIAISTAREVILADRRVERELVTEATSRGSAVFVAERSSFPARPSAAACCDCRFRAICPERDPAADLPSYPVRPQ